MLGALDAELTIDARPTTAAGRPPRAPFTRREERVAYGLHRTLAKRLIDNPDTVLAAVPENLARMRSKTHCSFAHELLDEWERLSKGPIGAIIDVALGSDERSVELRQNSPVAGALSNQDRLDAISRAAS